MDGRTRFVTSVSGNQPETAATADHILAGTSIIIEVSQSAVECLSGQVLTYQLATLLKRLFDRVTVLADERVATVAGYPFVCASYVHGLREHLFAIRHTEVSGPSAREIHVLIGPEDKGADLYLGCSPWAAFVSTRQPKPISNGLNTIGALAAGTLGASEVFKLVFRQGLKGVPFADEYCLSLLDYRTEKSALVDMPSEVSVEAVLFGCGSIGCGFLNALLLTPAIRGTLQVVDNGEFDSGNIFKYSLLTLADATAKGRKANWAAAQLQNLAQERLRAVAADATVNEYIASLPVDYILPLAIAAVDNFEARAHIQDGLPRRIINSGINGTEVEVSVHGFNDGAACLACLSLERALESWDAKPIADKIGLAPLRVLHLLQENGALTTADLSQIRTAGRADQRILLELDEFLGQPLLSLWNKLAYAERAVQLQEGKTVHVTTAFVSAYAGILLLAELVKVSVPELCSYRINNAYRQDLIGLPAEHRFKYLQDSRGWCLCHSSFRQAVYEEKYGTREASYR